MGVKIVKITWVDSYAEHGWCRIDELTMIPPLVESVGYVLQRNRVSITIVQSISDTEHYDHVMTIPRGCIKSIKELFNG